jgi:hypothetical protein
LHVRICCERLLLQMSDALSNQRPLLYEDSMIICQRFLQYAKCLQIAVFSVDAFPSMPGDLLRLPYDHAYI